MIDSMFQAGTDAALDDRVARPKPYLPDEPGFSFGALAKAPFQGVSSGSTKSAAFAAEILGAFGDVAGSTGADNQGGMFSTATDEERKQQEAARRKWIDSGPQFSNPAGDLLRAGAKDMMPDPTHTHAAAQVVAGIAEFASQAVAYTAGAGPLAPVLLAGDVGLAEADKLKQQGVDLSTRTQAGAVAGLTAGASIALPVAIPGSVAKTAALVAVGGPGGFVAQNAAERAIIKHAGYEKIADQYDPLDPVGLTLSTLVPAGFGAMAVRGARAVPAKPSNDKLHGVILGIESNGQRYAKDGSVLTSPKGAKGEMQVMDGTNLDPGFGVRPAANNGLEERARVGRDYIDAMLTRYGTEDKAMAAYNAGPGALDNALKRAAKEGGDWLGYLPAETQKYVANGIKKMGSDRTYTPQLVRGAIATEPDLVAAARVQQTAAALDSLRLTPDTDIAGQTAHVAAVETAHEQLASGNPVGVTDIVSPRAIEPQAVNIIKRRGEDMADVAATTKALPDVPDGHVRLFRAESPTVKFGDVFDATQLADKRGAHLPGARYTPDLKYADYYRASYGRDATVHYIDVPKAIAERGKIDDTEYKIDRSTLTGSRRFNEWADQIRTAANEARPTEPVAAPRQIARKAEPAAATGKTSPIAAALDELIPQLTGKQPGQLVHELQGSGKLSPLANNAIVGLVETKGEPRALAQLVSHADELANAAPGRPHADILADAIEHMRQGALKPAAETKTSATASAAADVATANPDMPLRASEDGQTHTASQELERVRREAAEGTDTELGSDDASLIQVAANCFLSTT